MAPAKKPTQGERIIAVEVKQADDRREIDDMHDEIKQMDVKMDGTTHDGERGRNFPRRYERNGVRRGSA